MSRDGHGPSDGLGLTPSQFDVAQQILCLPEARAQQAALAGGAAIIQLGLSAPRMTPDIDIHLPGHGATLRLLSTLPGALNRRGYSARLTRHWRPSHPQHHWLSLVVGTRAGDVVRVDVSTRRPIWPTVMVPLGSHPLPPCTLRSLILSSGADPAMSLIENASTPDTEPQVLLRHPRELVFRKAHAFLFDRIRGARATDLVDIDGLLGMLGAEPILSSLRERGSSRRLPETTLSTWLAKTIERHLSALSDDDFPIPLHDVSALRERLKRWSSRLQGGDGTPLAAADFSTNRAADCRQLTHLRQLVNGQRGYQQRLADAQSTTSIAEGSSKS